MTPTPTAETQFTPYTGPAEGLPAINAAIQKINSLQAEIDTIEAQIAERMTQPRCTGTSISGKPGRRQVNHSKGHNCPHPSHHRPDDQITKETRIRTACPADTEPDITAAMHNQGQIEIHRHDLQQKKHKLTLLINRINDAAQARTNFHYYQTY